MRYFSVRGRIQFRTGPAKDEGVDCVRTRRNRNVDRDGNCAVFRLASQAANRKTFGGSDLARRNRKDKVTVTFHYLTRTLEGDDGEPKTVPITVEEFQAAMKAIADTPPIDTTTQAGVDKLRFGSTVPVLDLSEPETNLFFGAYKAFTPDIHTKIPLADLYPTIVPAFGNFTSSHIGPSQKAAFILRPNI